METVNTNNREKQGKIASFVGIIVNVFLAVCKILVGAIFGLISVMAEGLNNLTDCGSSLISMISFKLSSKPADEEHPFGHERIEYVLSITVAFIILIVAMETVIESVRKIISPEGQIFSHWALIVLCASIFLKMLLFIYFNRTAKKIDSEILRATATDSLTDCISTVVVLACLIIGKILNVNIDGYAGVLVALFIAFAGIKIVKETFSTLIGEAPDKALIDDIKKRILAHKEVLGVHDLSVYCYGPSKYFASVHIEVDANVSVLVSHELVDDIEREFANETNIILTGHLDPIVVDDEKVNALREKICEIVKNISEKFSVHDFRMVFGERRTNVLFDVAIPYGTKITSADIKRIIKEEVEKIDDSYCLIITVEHSL